MKHGTDHGQLKLNFPLTKFDRIKSILQHKKMMLMNILRPFAFVVLLTTSVASALDLKLTTKATGSQEGTGVKTSTTGTLVTEFDPGFASVSYALNVFTGIKVTSAHLHCAAAGENGGVVAFLFNSPSGKNVNGVLSSGFLRNSDILNTTDFKSTPTCGVTINNIASLFSAIQKGLIYLNVHTVANPAGEIRGQVFP
jgi:hypothetical protein